MPLRVELDRLSNSSKRESNLAEEDLLSHMTCSSLSQPPLPKYPVSTHGSSPVLWVNPPGFCNPNGIIVLQFQANIQFLLCVLHAARSNVQKLQKHPVIQLRWSPFYPVMETLRSLLSITPYTLCLTTQSVIFSANWSIISLPHCFLLGHPIMVQCVSWGQVDISRHKPHFCTEDSNDIILVISFSSTTNKL